MGNLPDAFLYVLVKVADLVLTVMSYSLNFVVNTVAIQYCVYYEI